MRTVATDSATKTRVLQRAGEVGVPQAAHEFGIPPGTIRSWKSRAADDRALTIADDADMERVDRIIKKSEAAAEKAVDRLREVLPFAKNPRDIAISMGVVMDKVQLLADAKQALERHRSDISRRDAELIQVAMCRLFAALDQPWSPGSPAARVFADCLRNLSEPDWIVPVALSDAARDEVRETVRAEIEPGLRAKLEAELRLTIEREMRQAAVAALPPLELLPAGATTSVESTDLAKPQRRYVSEPMPVVERPRVAVMQRGQTVRALAPRYSESDFG